jgi:hypothetical protein
MLMNENYPIFYFDFYCIVFAFDFFLKPYANLTDISSGFLRFEYNSINICWQGVSAIFSIATSAGWSGISRQAGTRSEHLLAITLLRFRYKGIEKDPDHMRCTLAIQPTMA